MRRLAFVLFPLAFLVAPSLRAGEPDAAPPAAASRPAASESTKAVRFSRDIRPILADKCFACHGPDAAEVQADLRLDARASAVGAGSEQPGAIVPGKPDESELLRRVESNDEFEVMPPPETNKPLTPREKQLLRQWIADGAEYEQHWSFLPPTRPALPAVDGSDWPRNEIDHFILARLRESGLRPSEPAGKETLIRRVSLDLRGLPPTLDEVEEFLADHSEDAYERMVDRMLRSPHYGEKMARIWMDLARYGDTNGYHYDSTRQVWLWRDWVIDAYNQNMPFDQFTIEQLAGDLLPDATLDQKVASGFNRNTRYNEEGGADPAEWLVRYAVDRTSTLGQVWLGMTLNCAECHSHKYDPITQKEFYQLYAFFNSLNEPGAQGHNQQYPPLIQVPGEEHQRAIEAAEREIAETQRGIAEALGAVEYSEPPDAGAPPSEEPIDIVWIDDEVPAGAQLAGDGPRPWDWGGGENHPVHRGQRSTRRSGSGLNQHFFTAAAQPLEIQAGDVLFAHVWLDPQNPPRTVQLQFNDGTWEHRAYWGENLGHGGGAERPGNHRVGDLPERGQWVRLEVPAADVGLQPGAKINGWAFTQFDGTVFYDAAGVTRREPDLRHRKSLAVWRNWAADRKDVPDAIRKLLARTPEKLTADQNQEVRDYFVEHVWDKTRSTFEPLHQRLAVARDRLEKTKADIPFQLVSVELDQPRPAHVLMRGDFQKPGEQVERAVPAIFPPLPEGQPVNRLGLAHWLVRPDHPLTARVTVNRYWSQLFGRGIVETVGDFGHLGRFPSHPELLDWLAVEFMESGWDTKHLLKQMLMSATYRQSSVNDHRHDDVDPENRLLWRAARFRLPAEEIRDTALRIAGMLTPKIGGPPVYPHQPPDYYKGKKGGWNWNLSEGEDRYRRGMYTFWRRTTPYPSFIIFDAPDRSECTVSRARTNTPLQALVTMNDPQFVEAARVFAQRVLTEASDPGDEQASTTDARLRFAFRAAVARAPSDAEMDVLRRTLKQQLTHYGEAPQAAERLVQAGAYPRPAELPVEEHAAWTALANALLNLDETITRE